MASKDVTLPSFQATPFEDIHAKYERLRVTYRSGKTKDVQFRLQQLRKFYWAITDLEPLILAAVYKDLRKCYHEAVMTEVAWCKGEALDLINGLEKWVKDETVVGIPAAFWAMKHRVHYEPLGTVLVIGAFNYPFQLTLLPFLGAVAAGNTVMVKPSELSAFSAMVIEKVMEYMDPDCYACVNGALPVSQAVLDLKFNKIAFTGGKHVGKIIAKKAAETLTPTLLELGGQNPAFITKNANVKLAARRLLWGKTTNGGQVCLSHNYAFVERSVLSQFIGELNNQYRVFMPKGAKESPDYCRIVNKSNFDRIRKMLDDSKGKIVMGGSFDETDLYIEPTVVIVDDMEDSMITQESFGPIWSVVPFDNLDDAIDTANEVDPTPLALFAFGNDQETQKITAAVTSGGATVNDAFTHASLHCAPFGGVGESGNGTYHGYYSLKAFSHQRTVARVPNWIEKLLRVRYMPYQASDLKRFQAMNKKSVNFDRQGNANRGLGYWLALVLGLGGSGAKGAAVRWGILLALAYAFQLKRKSLGL